MFYGINVLEKEFDKTFWMKQTITEVGTCTFLHAFYSEINFVRPCIAVSQNNRPQVTYLKVWLGYDLIYTTWSDKNWLATQLANQGDGISDESAKRGTNSSFSCV